MLAQIVRQHKLLCNGCCQRKSPLGIRIVSGFSYRTKVGEGWTRLSNKTKTLSVGRKIYPSDRYRIVRGMMRRISVGCGRCALPHSLLRTSGAPQCVRPQIGLCSPSLFHFYCDKFEGTDWTHSRTLFLEWNEEVRGDFRDFVGLTITEASGRGAIGIPRCARHDRILAPLGMGVADPR